MAGALVDGITDATATPAPNAIPKADGSGKLDGWITTTNIPTADEKTRLGDIQAASGATTALKLAALTSNASLTQEGVVEVATAAEIVAGTDEARSLAPKYLKDATALADFWLTKRTKMPDEGTVSYSKTDFTGGVDGWVDSRSDVSVDGAYLKAVLKTGETTFSLSRSGQTIIIGSSVRVVFKANFNPTIANITLGGKTSSGVFRLLSFDGTWYTVQLTAFLTATALTFYLSGVSPGNTIWLKEYTYDTASTYLPGSLSEEAARIANLRGDMPGVGQYATQTITATDLATATKGDTIGGKKYTYVAALTASPGVEGEILKEATKEAELENLNLAISEVDRASNGTKYWAAAVHPLVSSARVNEVLTLTAKTKNGPENAITVVCESGTQHTAGGATLLGGYTDSAAKTKAENNAALGYVPAATPNKTATTSIGYFAVADCASGAQVTLPAGGTWAWEVTTYGATYNSVKSGTAAGGAAISGTASANLCMRYERIA